MESVQSPPVAIDAPHLVKSIRWWDGVALTLSLPAALFVSLGYSVAALGAWAAILLWAAIAAIAALHNWLYSELGAMFVDKAGGIALYANEAWQSRARALGPLATYAYWFAWATAPAIWGLAVAQILMAEFWPGASWSIGFGAWHLDLAQVIALLVAVISWAFSMIRLRSAMVIITAAGVLLMIPVAIFSVAGWFGSHASTTGFSWRVGAGWTGAREVFAWLFVMAWSAYAVEAAASFIPEFRDTVSDTQKALRVAAVVLVVVFAATPLGLCALLGEGTLAAEPNHFLQAGVVALFGGGAATMTVVLVSGVLVLSVMGTADAARALYQSACDGLTIRQFATLNSSGIPSRAVTVQLLINVALVLFVGNALAVIVAGNIGYILAHLLAVSGYLVLRHDRPDAPRPIRLAPPWMLVAAALTLFDALILIAGITGASITGYGGTQEVVVAIAVLMLSQALYYARRLQDRRSRGAQEGRA